MINRQALARAETARSGDMRTFSKPRGMFAGLVQSPPQLPIRKVQRASLSLFAAVVVVCLTSPAVAAPEEIQVYMDELNAPGEIGLDVHNNYVVSGSPGIDYEGEQASLHRYRVTPEWSLGLTRSLELGAYFPLASIDHDRLGVDGFKMRLKWLAPRPRGQKLFWGANLEIGREDHRLDPNPWNGELKGILGVHSGRWTAAANANLDFKISGPVSAPASLEIATKLSYAVSARTAIGIENYNGTGEIRHFGRLRQSDQATYLTADTSLGKWGLNVGVGHGYGSNRDRWIAKAIISVPLDWSLRSKKRAPSIASGKYDASFLNGK